MTPDLRYNSHGDTIWVMGNGSGQAVEYNQES